MFRKNTQHLQPAIISAASELPEKQRKRLGKGLSEYSLETVQMFRVDAIKAGYKL